MKLRRKGRIDSVRNFRRMEHFYEMSFCKKKKKVLNRLVKIE